MTFSTLFYMRIKKDLTACLSILKGLGAGIVRAYGVNKHYLCDNVPIFVYRGNFADFIPGFCYFTGL